MRALIGTYSTANQTGFHRGDGGGYRAVRRRGADGRPPQPAGRGAARHRLALVALAGAGAAGKARDALAAIAAQEGLSTDVRDIVERTLG